MLTDCVEDASIAMCENASLSLISCLDEKFLFVVIAPAGFCRVAQRRPKPEEAL